MDRPRAASAAHAAGAPAFFKWETVSGQFGGYLRGELLDQGSMSAQIYAPTSLDISGVK
jgi:hypothetical protein